MRQAENIFGGQQTEWGRLEKRLTLSCVWFSAKQKCLLINLKDTKRENTPKLRSHALNPQDKVPKLLFTKTQVKQVKTWSAHSFNMYTCTQTRVLCAPVIQSPHQMNTLISRKILFWIVFWCWFCSTFHCILSRCVCVHQPSEGQAVLQLSVVLLACVDQALCSTAELAKKCVWVCTLYV